MSMSILGLATRGVLIPRLGGAVGGGAVATIEGEVIIAAPVEGVITTDQSIQGSIPENGITGTVSQDQAISGEITRTDIEGEIS